jgi:hypothetical protein
LTSSKAQSSKETLERAQEPTILGEQSDDVWIGRKMTETARIKDM